MAHNLDITNGVASFADSAVDAQGRVSAWHKLGTPVGSAMTVDQALDAAHLRGWNVRPIPLTASVVELTDDGDVVRKDLQVPDKNLVVRRNPITGATEPLGVVGNRWTPFQNEDTTGVLSALVDEGGAHIETAGALNGGRDTFVTMRMPGHMVFTSPITGAPDVTDLYISVLNNHSGTAPFRALITPIRIVCANTQRLAEKAAASTVSLRHTGSISGRIAEIRHLLGLTFAYQEVFEQEMAALVDKQIDDDKMLHALNRLWEIDDASSDRTRSKRGGEVSEVMSLYQSSATVAPFRGTAFGAYNAVTEWADHFSPVRGGVGSQDAVRAERVLTGTTVSALKVKAHAILASV